MLVLLDANVARPAPVTDEYPGARTFESWHVTVATRNNVEYVKMWTTIPATNSDFEIWLSTNKGYRYYEPEGRIEYAFARLIDPEIYNNFYKSIDQVKTVGSFMLDEIIYPVGLSSMDSTGTGQLVTFVNNPPENFLTMLADCHILMFRFVSGISYMIPMNGFRAALEYANQLRNDYFDPARHPCYPLIHRTRY